MADNPLLKMPLALLADGNQVRVPVGSDGAPDWGAVGPLALSQSTPDSRMISRGNLLRRIRDAELAAMLAVQHTVPVVGVLMLRIQSADDEISLDDPLVINALDALAAGGLLAPERVAEIRA